MSDLSLRTSIDLCVGKEKLDGNMCDKAKTKQKEAGLFATTSKSKKMDGPAKLTKVTGGPELVSLFLKQSDWKHDGAFIKVS